MALELELELDQALPLVLALLQAHHLLLLAQVVVVEERALKQVLTLAHMQDPGLDQEEEEAAVAEAVVEQAEAEVAVVVEAVGLAQAMVEVMEGVMARVVVINYKSDYCVINKYWYEP